MSADSRPQTAAAPVAAGSLSIDGVPETISRERCRELIRSLGIDPNDLRSLEFHYEGIRAEVYALDAEGYRFIIDNEPAIHHLTIKVVDDE